MNKLLEDRFNKSIFEVIIIFLIHICWTDVQSQKIPDFKNNEVSVEKRVEDLLSRMTLEEKISQMSILSLSKLKTDDKGQVTEKSLCKLFKGKSAGYLESPFINVEEVSKYSEAADKYLRENTRLGIPAIQIAECLHEQLAFGAIIFPQAIAQGSTWNVQNNLNNYVK